MYTSKDLLHNILSLGSWATWKSCIDHVEEGVEGWSRVVAEKAYRRIYLVGCGSSFYAGQIGKFFIESVASIPAEARQAFSFSHYSNPELLDANTLVVGISTTGNTSSTCDALSLAQKEGAATLAITADQDSRITKTTDATIFTGGPVTVIVKTFEYIQSLIALYVLAFYLGHEGQGIRDEDHQYYVGQLRLAADATKHFFDEEQDKIVDLVDQYHTADGLFVLGNGVNVGTAEEAALKLIEMAKVYSDGCEMEDFFHGRDREITNRTPAFFLAPQSPAEEKMLDFLKFNQMVGVPSILLTLRDRPEYDILANQVISLQGELDEMLSPLIYITPMYVFGYHLALKRGFQPLARRYSVAALHVKYEEKD